MAQNGTSDYKIVVPFDAPNLVNVAAEELQLFFEKSTGVKLPIISDKGLSCDNSAKYISIGRTTLLEKQSDIVITYDDLGEAGACVQTRENTVYICGASDRGTLNSTYKFMEMQFGFKAYAYDCIHIDYYNELSLLNFNYKYDAVVDWNMGFNAESSLPAEYGYDPELLLANARMYGYVGGDGARGLDGKLFSTWCHTIGNILPQAKYPQYYDNGQMCYTNEEAFTVFCERLTEMYVGNQSERWIQLGGNDNVGSCQCENCNAANAQYGRSGVYMRFLNKVADYVEKYYEAHGIDRTLRIYSLSYYATEIPPLKTDEQGNFITDTNGNYVPVDPSVVPDSEGKVTVGIMFTPIGACWTHALGDETCEMNKETTQNFKGWANLTEDILLYNYGEHWLMPAGFHDTWSYYVGSYKFYEEIGVVYALDTGRTAELDPMSCFRVYFRNQFAWNPHIDFRTLLTDFCEEYYGPAAGMVEEYFYDYMEQHNSIYKKQNAPCRVYSIDITATTYWPRGFWLGLQTTLKNGMHLIEQSKYSEEEKTIYKERVFREYFLAVYHEYKYYSGSLSAAERAEKTAVLKEGFAKYTLKNDINV